MTTPRFRFPRERRLILSREFVRVRIEGQSVRDGVLRVGFFRREDDDPARLGLAVSRRAGNAVQRNRIKRVLREAFRLSPERFEDGLDLVVIPIAPARARDFHEVDRSLARLAERIADRLRMSSK